MEAQLSKWEWATTLGQPTEQAVIIHIMETIQPAMLRRMVTAQVQRYNEINNPSIPLVPYPNTTLKSLAQTVIEEALALDAWQADTSVGGFWGENPHMEQKLVKYGF